MKQECGHPMTRLYVIDCANSLIAGSTLVTAMNLFHHSNSKSPAREFGLSWYRNFMRRNNNNLENRRGERQHQLRKYWTTHENFVTMYDRVYATMVDEKVATPLDESDYYFINRAGSRFNTEEEDVVHHIKHCLSHPRYALFGDEVGTDTNQMDDGKMEVRVTLA